jgi:hypothetical protein
VNAVALNTEGRREGVRVDGNVATFSFRTAGAQDGLELTAPCASQIVVEGLADDGLVTLFIGPNATAVPAMPYLIAR